MRRNKRIWRNCIRRPLSRSEINNKPTVPAGEELHTVCAVEQDGFLREIAIRGTVRNERLLFTLTQNVRASAKLHEGTPAQFAGLEANQAAQAAQSISILCCGLAAERRRTLLLYAEGYTERYASSLGEKAAYSC